MKAIIRQVLSSRRRSTLIWCLAPSAYIVLVTAVYKSFLTANASAVNHAFAQLPETLRSFIQIQGDFFSPVGFLSSEPYYVILPLVLIALGIALGSSLLAREERDHTIELLLSRPVSRGRLLLGKGLGAVAVLALANIVVGLAVCICTRVFGLDGIGFASIWLAQLMLFLLALIFGALSFGLTAVGGAARQAAVGVSALLAITSYILTSLEGTVHWLTWPAWLLPYHYYNPHALLSGDFGGWIAICYAAAIVLLAILAWLGFARRDID